MRRLSLKPFSRKHFACLCALRCFVTINRVAGRWLIKILARAHLLRTPSQMCILIQTYTLIRLCLTPHDMDLIDRRTRKKSMHSRHGELVYYQVFLTILLCSSQSALLHSGRHPCPGMKLAKLEMKMIIGFFLAGYEFYIVDSSGRRLEQLPKPNYNDIFLVMRYSFPMIPLLTYPCRQDQWASHVFSSYDVWKINCKRMPMMLF